MSHRKFGIFKAEKINFTVLTPGPYLTYEQGHLSTVFTVYLG